MAGGVPALLGSVAKVTNTAQLVLSDVREVLGMFQPPTWGIYGPDGELVLPADSIYSVGMKRDLRISDYPVERGAFETYNKVLLPDDVRVTAVVAGSTGFQNLLSGGLSLSNILSGGASGSNAKRGGFLKALEDASLSTILYDVHMPEGPITGLSIIHFDFLRESQNGGVSMMTYDIWLRRVRVTAKATFTNSSQATPASDTSGVSQQQVSSAGTGTAGGTPNISDPAAPSGASPTNSGTVQPQAATPAQADTTPAGRAANVESSRPSSGSSLPATPPSADAPGTPSFDKNGFSTRPVPAYETTADAAHPGFDTSGHAMLSDHDLNSGGGAPVMRAGTKGLWG